MGGAEDYCLGGGYRQPGRAGVLTLFGGELLPPAAWHTTGSQ